MWMPSEDLSDINSKLILVLSGIYFSMLESPPLTFYSLFELLRGHFVVEEILLFLFLFCFIKGLSR
jgi:hypothetical protein